MMKQFFCALWNIIFLRGGPQNFPYSPVTLISLILVGLGAVALVAGSQVILLVSNLAFILMMVWILLYFTKKTERYIQTVTALIACEWLVALLLLSIWYTTLFFTAVTGHLKGVSPDHLSGIFSVKFDKDTLPVAVSIFLSVTLFTLGIWKLIINITIIRQATEWRFLRAMVFVIFINIVPSLIEQGIAKFGMTGQQPPTVKTINATAPAPTNTGTVIPLK